MEGNINIFGGKRAEPIIVIPDEEIPDERNFRAPVQNVPKERAEHVIREEPEPRSPPARREPRVGRVDRLRQLRDEIDAEPVRAAPVAAAVVPLVDYAAMTPTEKTEEFWKIINGLQWKNTSDGYINAARIRNTFSQFSRDKLFLFTEKYNELFELMTNRLELDGMFERNEVHSLVDRAKIVSHAIAMGRDQYQTLFDDLPIYQFLIESGECQSLDVLLPEELQH